MKSILMLILILAISVLIIGFYAKNKRQSKHSLLRAHPIIGYARYGMESLGKYLRPWIIESDSDGRPFDRNQRSQVYRMSKGLANYISFGSTSAPKDKVFKPSMFPTTKDHSQDGKRSVIVGTDCRHPFIQNKVFNISGMSFGALSGNAIQALSMGAAKAGVTMNTGEGGIPSKYHRTPEMMALLNNQSEPNSKGGLVIQVGTANFGFQDKNGHLDIDRLKSSVEANPTAWIQIKMSQGAKPGDGGHLPGAKVTKEIAELRSIEEGKPAISPVVNPSFDTPEKLAKGIRDIKIATGKPVGIKMVLGNLSELKQFLMTCMEMDHALDDGRKESHLPSVITIDGGDGGSGSAPAIGMESLGSPVLFNLPKLIDMLKNELGIKERVAVVASGKLITPHDVAMALAHGASWVESARGFMFSLGCLATLQCQKGTCVVGVASQSDKLSKALVPFEKATRVANYAINMEKEVKKIAQACGLNSPFELRMKHVEDLTVSEIKIKNI